MFASHITLKGIDQLEKLAYSNHLFYRWTLTHLPADMHAPGVLRAWQAFERAQKQVPAYRQFLAARNFLEDRHGSLDERFASIPPMDKNNYVRVYSTAERCVCGRIPATHVLVDESSGSTGLPYNWVRSRAEIEHTRRACSYFHRYYFGDEPLFVINAFSMGAWATGVTMGAALEANGIVKSTGPDVEKIVHTLRFFGPKYRYLVTGYPPFLKHLVDYANAQGFDWKGYRLVAMVGGEGMSENLRRYLQQRFEKVVSGYGASDLEIGIAGESDLSIYIRQLMAQDADLRRLLIGDEHRTPMLFQYNPIEHYIETNEHSELIITINRPLLSPRIRYNIKDEGGVLSFEEMCARLRMAGIDLATLLRKDAKVTRLPFLYVFGRCDSTISYMGANIYPEDVEAGLLANHEYASKIGAFCMELVEDASTGELRPCIYVEVTDGELSGELAQTLQRTVHDKLYEVNADFRHSVYEDASAGEIKIELHRPGAGPFARMHGCIKRRYILDPAQRSAVAMQ